MTVYSWYYEEARMHRKKPVVIFWVHRLPELLIMYSRHYEQLTLGLDGVE